jgi:RNA ligase
VIRHLAHTIPYDDLAGSLRAARDARLVYEKHGPGGLVLYVYTSHCVFEQAWTLPTLVARGLILHPQSRRIVATPFPKFFNAGERDGAIPDLSFEATEKLDGSLIILFHHAGCWRTATKGAFESEQAVWAAARLGHYDLAALTPGTTYLAEATYPENKIVVAHSEASMRLLGAYGADGIELPYADVVAVGARSGFGSVARVPFESVAALMAQARGLAKDHEGYVLRFSDGLRLKVKGDEYRRIHALISNLTPLALWEAMVAGADLLAIKRDLPEEFWGDFDQIVARLDAQRAAIVARIESEAAKVAPLSDKELGLRLKEIDDDVRGFLFDWRKSGGKLAKRSEDKLLRMIRPTSNILPGYTPSFAITRVAEESG